MGSQQENTRERECLGLHISFLFKFEKLGLCEVGLVCSFLSLSYDLSGSMALALQALVSKDLNLNFASDSHLQIVTNEGQFSPSEIQEYQHLPDVQKILQSPTCVGDLLGLAPARAGDHDCTKTHLTIYAERITDRGSL